MTGEMTLGAIIRARRTELGLAVSEMAPALKVTPAYIRMIERGERIPSEQLLERLLSHLGLTHEIFERSVSIEGYKAVSFPKSNDEAGSSISTQVLHELIEIRTLLQQLVK